MNKFKRIAATIIAASMISLTTFISISPAQAQIDVSHLQACLKEEGSSLDVLVLMDSSRSLRDAKPDEANEREFDKGSDPERLRGKILKSSLKILRTLAEESDRSFNISLRNFGKNSDPDEKKKLMDRWVEWTGDTSDSDLKVFVDKAVYDDSPGTQWTNGLISAQDQFKKRIGEAKLAGTNSCSIMFWITDGAPTDPTAPICAPKGNASINWFRENNILILGGLLKPQEKAEADKAAQFGPLVRGETCGENRPGWTKGEVIEAKDVSDLAWGFVGLIAGIKNLINLNGNGSSFEVDPSTSHIEIYTRKDSTNWEIKKPDGTVFCSKTNPGSQCLVENDSDVGIVTITIFPDKPIDAAGQWTISPGINADDFLVYGGLNTTTEKSRKTKPNLLISQFSPEAEEGKEASFLASLTNPDGSPFSLSGYKSVSICAKIESSEKSSCENGKTSANLTVTPSTTDKSVSFEAILISQKNPSREYRITATAKISVIPSGLFPSLSCEKSDPCVLSSLSNKNSKGVSTLLVNAPKSGSQSGSVTLLSATILADAVQDRGDGHFNFVVQKANGQTIELGDESQQLNPGEKLTLTVTTDLGGSSLIQGVIKYKVSANGQEIVRQLDFKFDVGAKKNWLLQIALMLLAYLLTIGLPYAFLLWSARRRAFLTVPDNEFAYMEQQIAISQSGKVSTKSSLVEGAIAANFLDPSHQGLKNEEVPEGSRSISIGSVQIEVIPPKWNPFVEPSTHVYIPGSHVMTTFGSSEFLSERAFFSRTLTGEALIYFSTEENLAPTMQSQTENLEPVSNSELFSPLSSGLQKDELNVKTGDVIANVMYIVPRYSNRRKSLGEVNSKLKDTVEGANLSDHLKSLRQIAFEAEQKRLEQLESANAETSSKKSKKAENSKEKEKSSGDFVEQPSKSFSIFEDELGKTDSSFNDNEKDDPNSGSSKKLWD